MTADARELKLPKTISMKKLLFLVFPFLLGQAALGQEVFLTGGGAGHFVIGPSIIIQPRISDYLKEPQVLGASYNAAAAALQIGGEGYAMIDGWIIGGGGFALSGLANSSGNGKAIIGGAGGYFKSGYRFWTKETNFFTGNIAIGSFLYNLSLENSSTENGIAFNKNAPVFTGQKSTYNFNAMLFDPSISFKGLVLGSKNENGYGGFLLGVDAGCMFNVAVSGWKSSYGTVEGPPSPGFVAVPYLRLTLGGGGFGYRK